MVKSHFLFAGRSSAELGLSITEYPSYTTAQRVVDTYDVPGRSGALVFDTGAYGNVTQTYSVYLKAKPLTTYQAARSVAAWLLGARGYQRLEDSYDPDVYRLAAFTGPLDVSSWFAKYGRATLEFNCMPQRWLKSGQLPVTPGSGDYLYNPGETALPLIQITGSGAGTLSVGAYRVTISDIPAAGLTLDAETQDAYSGTQNANSLVTLASGFPVLQPGQNVVAWGGGVTGVQITPRWWQL